MNQQPNLLVLGASGGVANAFLHHLVNHRDLFGTLVLLDRNNQVRRDPYLDHRKLNYRFVRHEIIFPRDDAWYARFLAKHKIRIVLDITDMDSVPIIEATNAAGVSYVNTAMNDEEKTVTDLIFDIYPRKDYLNGAPHILCTGMNPGNVNMWVRCGIEKFGVPQEVIHFEYDTSKVAKRWHPIMTWSVKEFLVESVRDPSGIALGRKKVQRLLPNALENREGMRRILEPVFRLPVYPHGFTVLHEENLTVSQKYDIPSRFIYAVHPKTMANLVRIYEKKKNVLQRDLEQADNTTEILDGADSIGVLLQYPKQRVYYFNTIPNVAIIGTSATYTQVVIGIFAALCVLLFDRIKPGAYFVEDLYRTHFRYYLFDNMRVQEYVFREREKRYSLVHYNPEIKIKRRNHFEHLFL